jgi:hypothetical protein
MQDLNLITYELDRLLKHVDVSCFENDCFLNCQSQTISYQSKAKTTFV